MPINVFIKTWRKALVLMRYHSIKGRHKIERVLIDNDFERMGIYLDGMIDALDIVNENKMQEGETEQILTRVNNIMIARNNWVFVLCDAIHKISKKGEIPKRIEKLIVRHGMSIRTVEDIYRKYNRLKKAGVSDRTIMGRKRWRYEEGEWEQQRRRK